MKSLYTDKYTKQKTYLNYNRKFKKEEMDNLINLNFNTFNKYTMFTPEINVPFFEYNLQVSGSSDGGLLNFSINMKHMISRITIIEDGDVKRYRQQLLHKCNTSEEDKCVLDIIERFDDQYNL